jgi:N-acetylmuramoyl-L-alanine amidase-like protein
MRRLPAVLLAAVTAVPVLIAASSSTATAAPAFALTVSTAASVNSIAPNPLAPNPLMPNPSAPVLVRSNGAVSEETIPSATAPGAWVTGASVPDATLPGASVRTASEPTAVATRVHRLSLAGVDADALNAFRTQSATPGARGAPGATAALATNTPAVLTRLTNTERFQTLGVSWRVTATKPDLLISVRTHSAEGWSGWDPLDEDEGDEPTASTRVATGGVSVPSAETVRGGTAPSWVGPSDGVQARIVVRSGKLPADLKLELVDPGTSGHDAVVTSDSPEPTPKSVAQTTAAGKGTESGGATLSIASANRPALFSRAQWGADEGRVRDSPTYMSTVKGAVLHHTAGKNNYSKAQVPSIIRGDYGYHLSRGWDDIGYNALVDRFGRIWEGRAGGLDRAVMGAHAGGFNTNTFGVAMLGNYDVSRPSAASISAVARVLAWELDLRHRDPLGTTRLTSSGGGTARYAAGRTVTLPVIMGHRNTGYTACPGRYLYPYLGSIRRQARTLMKAALLDPSGPPSTVPRGTSVSITARALARQSWVLQVTAPFGGGRVARIRGSVGAGKTVKATWNGRLTGGGLARPGRYRLTLTSSSVRGVARPVVANVLVVPPKPIAEVPAEPSSGSGGYHPVTPTRLLDTRVGGRTGLGPNGRVDVRVLGLAGVPATGVSSVVLNLTASGVSDDTVLSVWPTGRRSSRPVTGVRAGITRSVTVVSRVGGVGGVGSVSIGNSDGVTELTADVVGYFAAGGSSIQAIAPTRLYDSKDAVRTEVQPRLIPLPAVVGGVPSTQITGVIVDLSALSPTGAGSLTVHSPATAGVLPTLTYRSGESVDNLAFVPVSGGAIALRTVGAPVNAVIDVRAVLVAAEVTGSLFTAVKPVSVLDTRTTGGAIRAGSPRQLMVTGTKTAIPVTAKAVLVNLTAIAPANRTWLQAYAFGQTEAFGTALRTGKGDTRGNLVLVPLGPGGAIMIANARGGVQVKVDVHGYLE